MELEVDNQLWIGVIILQNGQKDFSILSDKLWLMTEHFGWVSMTLYSVLELYTFVEFSIKIFGKELVPLKDNGREKQLLDYQLKSFRQLKCLRILIMESR